MSGENKRDNQMKSSGYLRIIIICCLLYTNSLWANNANHLLLTNIQLEEHGKTELTVSLNILNLTRQNITFGTGAFVPEDFAIKFEESFERNSLKSYKEDIKVALFDSNFDLNAGKYKKKLILILKNNKPLAKIKIAQDNSFKKARKGKSKSKKTSKQKPKQKKKATKKEEIIITRSETEIIEENTDIYKEEIKHKNTDSERIKDDENTTSVEESSQYVYGESKCIDLVIDTLKILKHNRKTLIVEYTIRNKGNSEANLYGDLENENDNLALRAFLGSSERLTRGSLPLGGTYVKKGLEKGILLPQASYTNTIKLDIGKMTRFTPYIIFNLDPFNTIEECDRTNNKKHILLN